MNKELLCKRFRCNSFYCWFKNQVADPTSTVLTYLSQKALVFNFHFSGLLQVQVKCTCIPSTSTLN